MVAPIRADDRFVDKLCKLAGEAVAEVPKTAMLDQAIAPTMTDDIFIYELSMMASETLQRLPKTAI